MFKKLFGGDKGGGGGGSSSRPPAAPRANATQGTVDAIQKLGEVRRITFCKRIVHQAFDMCLPAPFTDLKWQCALPPWQVHRLPAQCTESIPRLCTASCQLCPALAQGDRLPPLQAYEMMEKKYKLLEKKMNECQEQAREYMQAKNKRGEPRLAASCWAVILSSPIPKLSTALLSTGSCLAAQQPDDVRLYTK